MIRAFNGIGADRCGAAVFDEPPLILEGKSCILGGDQLGIALYLGIVGAHWKRFAARVAQRCFAGFLAGIVGRPACLHILAFPQAHFEGSGIFHAETNDRPGVRAAKILRAFVPMQFEPLGQFAAHVVQQRAPGQIFPQCPEALGRSRLSAPVFKLRQILVKQRFFRKILEAFSQRKRRSLIARARPRFRRGRNDAFALLFVQHADGRKRTARRYGDQILDLFLHEADADKLHVVLLFGNIHAADHIVDLTEFLHPTHGLRHPLPVAGMPRQWPKNCRACRQTPWPALAAHPGASCNPAARRTR